MPPATEKATKTSQPRILPPPTRWRSCGRLADGPDRLAELAQDGFEPGPQRREEGGAPDGRQLPRTAAEGATRGCRIRGGSQSLVSPGTETRSICVTSGEESKSVGSRSRTIREVRAKAAPSAPLALNCGAFSSSASLKSA